MITDPDVRGKRTAPHQMGVLLRPGPYAQSRERLSAVAITGDSLHVPGRRITEGGPGTAANPCG